MGKKNKHMKQVKSEKTKVQLKTKKVKHLPKGLNVTEASFKVKKVIIREQLKQYDSSEILSKRKLNIKDLLSRLQHHNGTVRQEAVKELKEVLTQHSSKMMFSQFGPLLQGILALSLDKEKDIRRDSLKVLGLILSPVSNEQLTPFCDILISHLICAMTHIDPHIKEDALLFLDILIQNCSSVLAKHSRKILPSFLEMISKLQTEIGTRRQLITAINAKTTSTKWRIKVLERLTSMFGLITSFYKSQEKADSNNFIQVAYVDKPTRYVPMYNNVHSQSCEIIFEENENMKRNTLQGSLGTEELINYIELLMPLIFDSWTEVCPDKENKNHLAVLLNEDAIELLEIIVKIMQLIIECIDMLNCKCDTNMKVWFRDNFQGAFLKTLLSRFPYSKLSVAGRTKKRQKDFSCIETHGACLSQNLGISHVFVWLSCIRSDEKLNKAYCSSIVQYLNGKLENWTTADNSALLQLSKLLRTLFLRASKLWYENNINLSELLQSVINACCNQSKRELQTQLSIIVSDIMLDHTLHELHRERTFKEFVSTLPSLLLKPRIGESTIQIINKIVLRYRNWIQGELLANQDAIIENAKTVEIIGSNDVKRSRLTICNLFYFVDAQIYY